ncbi:MAG: thioredoxin family protein [Thermaurantimonas sp.]
MKKILFLVLLCFDLSYGQGIEFLEGSFEDALTKAKLEGKLVFVDAYTTWCGPCKWLSKEVFPDEELGAFYNKNFISIQLDMERGEGIEFAEKYAVRAFPTLIYFDANGKEIHRLLGAREAARLLAETREIMIEDNRFISLKNRVESTNSPDKNDLRKYLVASGQQGNIDDDRMKKYLSQMKDEDWKDLDILELIIEISAESEDCSDIFTQGIFQNYHTIVSALDASQGYRKQFDQFIYQKLAQSFSRKIDDKTFDNSYAENFVKHNENLFDKERIRLLAERRAQKNQNDPKKLLNIDHLLFEKYEENPDVLNNAAWEVVKNPDATKKQLRYALSWAQKSVNIDENFYNTDTLAHLLFRLKRYEEAKKWATRSIELGIDGGEDVTLTEILLSRIKSKGNK